MFIRLLLLLGCLVLPSSLLAFDAKQVFDAVSPSTVLIEDVDSFGSGVFLNDKGLILTNYHVVAGNISLKVRARVRFGNRIVLTELDDVKVTKIHRTYDIALLEVKPPPNGTFIPARFVPLTPPVATGAKCYALGNPGGPDGKALELSITEGIVSSAARKMDDLDYIQVSAQINPGNSGGPICDEFARVFGIVTAKMTDTEGIGFAIPTQKLNMADFIDPKAKPANVELFRKAMDAGVKIVGMAQMARGAERQALLLEGAEAFHIAMLAAPNNPATYENLSVVYYQAGDREMAGKYAQAAFRIEPNDANSCHILGGMLYDSDKQSKDKLDKSLEFWFRGLAGTRDLERMSQCADDVALAMKDHQQYAAAAYMFRWAEVLANGLNRDMGKIKRAQSWIELQSIVPLNHLQAIRAKTQGFSRADFNKLVSGKTLADIVDVRGFPNTAPAIAPNLPSATPNATAKVNPMAGKPVVSIPVLKQDQADRIVTEATEKFGKTQVGVSAAGLDCPLPEVAKEAILAYAGWQMVVSFPDLQKLGVYNIATGKLDGFIECVDPEVKMAAGGQILALFLPSTQTIEFYDLATLKKLSSKQNPAPGPIAFIGMGILNPTRVFVLYTVKNNDAERTSFLAPALLSVPDFKVTELTADSKSGGNPFPEVPFYRPIAASIGAMDETGNVAEVIQQSVDQRVVGQYVIKDSSKIEFTSYPHPFASNISEMTCKPELVVMRREVFDLSANKNSYQVLSRGGAPYFLTAVAGYPAVVALHYSKEGPGFHVFGVPSMNVLASVPMDGATYYHISHMNSKDQIERMVASIYSDRIAYLLPAEKKILLYPLGLKNGGGDAGFAKPGKHFERKLDLPAGATVTVQSAPPGMKFDEKLGALIWEVPADITTGQLIRVIMLVKGADDKEPESYMVEKVSVP